VVCASPPFADRDGVVGQFDDLDIVFWLSVGPRAGVIAGQQIIFARKTGQCLITVLSGLSIDQSNVAKRGWLSGRSNAI
jgi:hypothetical protein